MDVEAEIHIFGIFITYPLVHPKESWSERGGGLIQELEHAKY